MKEAVIQSYCDVDWKTDKVKVPGVFEGVFGVEGKWYELVLCEKHASLPTPISHTLGVLIKEYGIIVKEASKSNGKRLTKATAKATTSTIRPGFFCKCGAGFDAERKLNMHIGQKRRYDDPSAHGKRVIRKLKGAYTVIPGDK